jgi:hypothetical protein
LIPLFVATQHLKGEVIFIVVQGKIWWWMKYEAVVKQLSHHPPVFLEQSDQNVHCFPEVVVGVKVHDELGIDPSLMPHNESIRDFQVSIYSAKCRCVCGWRGDVCMCILE